MLAKNRKRNSTRLIILGRTLNMTNGKTVRSCMVRRSRSPKIRLFCSLINCKADTTSVLRVQQTLGFGLELKLIPTRASEPEGHASHRASHASHPSKGNEKWGSIRYRTSPTTTFDCFQTQFLSVRSVLAILSPLWPWYVTAENQRFC